MAVMRGMARSAQNAVVLVKWGIMAWGESKGCGAVQESSTAPCRNASPDRASVSVPLQGMRARTAWRRRQAEIQSSKWAA